MLLPKQQLVNNIINELSDNASEAITPYHIRHNLLDLLDSLPELFSDLDISSNNAKTPETRSCVFGQEALARIGFPNYYSEDNSAFGFSALRLNFRGARNTAIGSQSLRTNIYGSDNIAIGYDSLAGNVTGSGNVSIGGFGLTSNRSGSFNVSIGHGAGHYIGGNDSYQFFLGSHPVDSGVVCDDPGGLNLVPLLRGDMSSNKLGINVKSLVNDATLQIGGHTVPSEEDTFDIGSAELAFRNIFSSNLYLSDTRKFSNSDNVYFNFDLVPEDASSYDLGSSSNPLGFIHADNLVINTSASIQNAEFINSSYYLNKTLNLAAKPSGVFLDGGGPYSIYDYAFQEKNNSLVPYLSLEEVNNAGLKIHVDSGETFNFLIDTSDANNIIWKSNISLDLGSGNYIKTDRVMSGPEFSVDFGDNTLSLKDDYFYFGNKFAGENNTLGFGNINFYCSGNIISSYLSSSAGDCKISQRIFSNSSGGEAFGSYTGFEIEYEDALNQRNAFSVKSFSPLKPGKIPLHSLILSRDDDQKIFGISDINEYIPEATADFNIQDDCTLRIKSRGLDKTSKILLNTNNRGNAEINCNNGLEFKYNDVPAGKIRESHLDLFNNVSGTHNFTINIGDQVNKRASIGLVHSETSPVHASGYASIFFKSKNSQAQKSTMFFMDEAGNEFDLVKSSMNSGDGLIYIDSNNTVGGLDSFIKKTEHDSDNNTGFGFSSLKEINTGSNNSSFGSEAGKSLTSGSNNVAIGYKSLLNNKTNRHNVCIGTDGIGSNIDSDFNLLIGTNDEHILMRGVLGPNNENKKLELPKNGTLEVKNSTDSEYVRLKSNSLEVVDETGLNYPDSSFNINFTGNFSNTLLSLNHESPPLSNVTNYAEADGPFAELSGNLKIKGGIYFGDGTFLDSSDSHRIDNIENSQNSISSVISSLLIEGVANSNISKPNNVNSSTYGQIKTLQGENVTIHNRDTNLSIKQGDYIIAIKIGTEYRPIWVSNEFNALVSF
jgi:hypothetical protein